MTRQATFFAGARINPLLILGMLVVVWIWSGLAHAEKEHPAKSSASEKFALLVGVAEVPGLPNLPKLQGVPNDIEAMRRLALRLGVPKENLKIIAERNDAVPPTYAAIVAAMHWIETAVPPGGQILAYFAGHGGQQPVQISNDIANPELDGLDEIFFGSDARPWDERKGAVPNALTDNEVGQWLSRLNAKRATVWLVADMCHAGTFSRSGKQATEGNYRIVAHRGATLADIGIDPARVKVRPPAQKLSPLSRIIGLRPRRDRDAPLPGVTAFYATDEQAQAAEVVPRRGNGEVHGLFTLLLSEETDRLLTAPVADTVTNYRLLMQRVLARYRRDMPKLAEPTFEGVGNGRWF